MNIDFDTRNHSPTALTTLRGLMCWMQHFGPALKLEGRLLVVNGNIGGLIAWVNFHLMAGFIIPLLIPCSKCRNSKWMNCTDWEPIISSFTSLSHFGVESEWQLSHRSPSPISPISGSILCHTNHFYFIPDAVYPIQFRPSSLSSS